ncbi:unnamed protein product [Rotaria magnacalcarata]|uniref:Reverse transcriptase domain-containing protein n=1 Tax=Rotaria magnacalcarata TaxID=392030 RepID=A0A820A1Z1_9BILA|nr:unnamed protein product [Rotaria magnacalcarata]
MDSHSIYTSELIKSLLKTDGENYKVVPNKGQPVSATWWKDRGMDFPAKKLGFKAVIVECLKIGRELSHDTTLSSGDLISCDRTIKNEINKLAANERLLLKDRLIEAVKYGGVCIRPDIWSDKYRKISHLGATAHFAGKDTKYCSVDLFCTEFTARKKVLLCKELACFGLENHLSDIIFVTDRGANFVKGLNAFTVLFLFTGKKTDRSTTTKKGVLMRIEKTPNKTTKYRTTIEASREIYSGGEMTDDENTYDTDESEITDDDDIIDYSSITIMNLPTSSKELFRYYSLLRNLAYHPLKQLLNERQESSRLEKININVVAQLIKFLDPWKYVMNEIQLSNSPSLFITLPCIAYLKQQITKSERTMRGGTSFFAKRSLQLLESMFKIEHLHVMGIFLHPNYKQLKYATQIQIIECHNSCRLAIPSSSTSTYSASNDNNEINKPLTKKLKRFLESLMDDITPHKFSRKIFAVPCSSAAVEREFSAAGQLVTQRRSNIKPSTISDILFLRSIENNEQRVAGENSNNHCPDSCSNSAQGVFTPAIINEAIIKLTEQEHQLLKLGPRFIFDGPNTASRRRINELTTFKRKIEAHVLVQKLHTGQNINEVSINQNGINLYDNLLDTIQSSQSQQNNSSQPIIKKKKKNYGRTVKRLKYKIRLACAILRKSDKSTVFHLGKVEDYQKKSKEFMDKIQTYKCIGITDPLPDLILRTNKCLLDLRLVKWITQKQYEQLSIKPNEVESAHLYYLPKAHKPGTPLRPIISGLKHPTVKISKYLDDLLRPLFDQMALETTVTSDFELVKHLQERSKKNMRQETLFCTADVTDLYTMVPQIEGVLSLRKMLERLKLKQVGGLKIETIIRLSRFVMKNNYFNYDGQYYHQVRGGAMGSPLTLTIANCYMFFFEQQIIKQISNSGGLYFRYIDDTCITVNWPAQHLFRQVDRWNKFDENIKLLANIGSSNNFLDLYMENKDGKLLTSAYQKPSYEPYYLPFNSIHPLHIKKNIPYIMLLRTIRYCSTFQSFLNDREKLKIPLILNMYPNKLIEEQFTNVLLKHKINPH